MCLNGFLVLVLVLDCTQCLPQGAGAPPAMLRGRMTGFPKNWGPGPPERQDKGDTIFTFPIECGTPTTRRLYPFGASLVVLPEHHLCQRLSCSSVLRLLSCTLRR